MVQRVFSAPLLIYMGFYFIFSPLLSQAVTTNSTASPWTREKAEHLARKALIGATPTAIDALHQAGSSTAAVNILFPDTTGPDRISYDAEVLALTSSGFSFTNEGNMRKLYQLRYYRDPYEAKVKLFSLFEDIFSVNQSSVISYTDIKNQHDLLYTHTLGNYKTLVKGILFNNGQSGDYAEGKFLDLLDQSNKNSPNENYARELLQLFLMGEYKPGESKELGSTRNYEETDVAALAKILTGLESNSGSHVVSYNPVKHNTSTGVLFLSGVIASNPFSSFYDSASGTLDLGVMETPISGNNGLTDNTIEYIFAQRSEAISLFLADRLFRFYIHGKPTRAELDGIAINIRASNFELLPVVKSLLASDVLYSDASMNGVSYKNPLELAIGTLKILHDKDPLTLDPRIYDTELLNMLGWRPYFPGSIFGREGFDDNNKWFTAYTQNQWISFSTRLASVTSTGSYLFANIVPVTSTNSGGTLIDATVDEVLTQVEDTLLSSRRLPEDVKVKIRTYATTSSTGAIIPFVPSNTTVQNTKIRGIIALALASPEFILQTGYDTPAIAENTTPSVISSTPNKLVFIELSGGYDWLHGIIPKDQYASYQSLRTNSGGTIAIAPENLTDLGDFYMNNALAYSGANGPSLKSLYDSNNLRIFNRVGTPKHSRDHDAAAKQITSYSNTTLSEDDGAFGHIIKTEIEGSNTISLSGRRPNIFRNGNYINIGPSGAVFTNYAPIVTAEKTSQLNLFRDVFASRTYPGNTNNVFKNAAKIDEVATISVANEGPNGSGYGNVNNFAFLRSLLASGVGKTFYMQADGGYDTHSNQLAPSSNFDPNNIPRDLNYNIGRVVANATAFFNAVKDTQNITIVIYSEFGRTIRVNGDLGTDHGQWGGAFVLTNNPTLQSNLSSKIYGNMDLLREKSNWLGVGIDYRSMYGKLFNALYGFSDSFYFTAMNRLEDNIENIGPRFALARNEFRPGYNTNSARLVVPFRIEDPNFHMDYGSNLEIEYGTGFSNLRRLSQWSVDNAVRKPDGTYLFDVGVFAKNTPYVYRIRAIDNQFHETVFTGTLNIPDVRVATSSGTVLSQTTDTLLSVHANRAISGTLPLIGNISILLAENGTGTTSTIVARNGINIQLGTGTTRVESVASVSGTTTWNGGFILWEAIQKDFFLSSGSVTNTGVSLSALNIEKIIKIGADTLGVQMNLNQPVTLSITGMTSNNAYTILRSEDGLSWVPVGTGSINAGTLTFSTSTFSYFALVSGDPVIVTPPTPPVTPSPLPSSGGWGGGSGLSMDSCPNGDSSPSYYDRICGNPQISQNTVPQGRQNGNMNTVPWKLFSSNPTIRDYSFPSNERVPQKVASELNFIITKIARVLDTKAGRNEAKKKAYYQAVDAYMLKLWKQTNSMKDKRILEYLHTRLGVISKGILSQKPGISSDSVEQMIPSISISAPPVSGEIFSPITVDLSHPLLVNYDYTQNKRFPKNMRNILDSFVALIVREKIESKNPSLLVRDALYDELLKTWDEKIETTESTRERKIFQYMRTETYIGKYSWRGL